VRFSFALPSLLPLFFDRNIACPSNISIPPSNTGFLPRIFSIEFLSLVLQQLHFPDLTHGCLFDHTKLSRAHILELGCVPLKPPPHILKFPQSSYSPQIHEKSAPERDSSRSRSDPWCADIRRRTLPRSSLSSAKTWSRRPRLRPLAPSQQRLLTGPSLRNVKSISISARTHRTCCSSWTASTIRRSCARCSRR